MFWFKGLDTEITAGIPVNVHSVQLQQFPVQYVLIDFQEYCKRA